MTFLAIIILLIPPALILDGIRRLISVKRSQTEPPNKKYLVIGSIIELVLGVLIGITEVCLMIYALKVLKAFT